MAGADEEKSPINSDAQEEENGTETVSKRPATDEEADQDEDQQAKKRKCIKRRSTIDWSDQSTFSPSKPKNFMSIEELENERKAKKKEQQLITKAAKAATRKQKQLAEKASTLTNEDLIEIVQQRRHRQEEKGQERKRESVSGKRGIQAVRSKHPLTGCKRAAEQRPTVERL